MARNRKNNGRLLVAGCLLEKIEIQEVVSRGQEGEKVRWWEKNSEGGMRNAESRGQGGEKVRWWEGRKVSS